MADNKDKKVLNVPHLRFPEFTEGWEEVTLKEVADFQKDRVSTELLNESTYISTENIQQNFGGIQLANTVPTNANVIAYNKNDILLSNIRPYLKKVWLADRNGGCSADVFVLRSRCCEQSFLYNVIASDRFIGYVMSGAKGVKMPRGDKKQMENFKFSLPSVIEQRKISRLLSLLDERIATQNKIIEDLKSLKSAIIERVYRKRSYHSCRIGDVIEQISVRNKDKSIDMVLSVSNKQGFINQSEQFEDRIIASEDTSNYKIVHKNDFAYNPARINVGSIARLRTIDMGIVSPMYICFRVRKEVVSEYLEYFFSTSYFFYEMQKRLEGSVRQCLSFEGICNIPIYIPSSEEQHTISKKISVLLDKIDVESCYLSKLEEQKQYLLRQMFI